MPKAYLNYTPQKVEKKADEPIVSRSEAVSRIFSTDNGEPFSFEGREYLKQIYDLNHRHLVVVASRQAEKSTFLAKDLLLDLSFGKNDRLLYVTSSLNQVNEFVSLKINSQFQFNPLLKRLSFGRKSRNNALEKWFENGSRIIFRAIGNKTGTVRGVSVRKIYFDEVQDMDPEGVAVTKECASHYTSDSAFIYAGTPFCTRNILSKLYKETCQFEWVIPCSSCKKDNPPLGIQHIDTEKPHLFCSHCGEPISASQGRWEAQNPRSKKTGYRISRLMTPNCVWRSPAHDGVLDKYETYPEAQFFQEVLGLPYDSGSSPITEEEIFANCEDYSFMSLEQLEDQHRGGALWGAMDWAWSDDENGMAYTIFAVGLYYANKIEIIYTKRFFGSKYHNPEVVVNEIIDICIRLNLKGIATDYGVGHKENKRFRDYLKNRGRSEIKVLEMYYVTSPKEYEWNSDAKYYNIGRTATLDLVFHRLRKKLYRFPRREEMESFADDIMNLKIKYDPSYKRIQYVPSGAGPDDFLHLLNYLAIALEIFHHTKIR